MFCVQTWFAPAVNIDNHTTMFLPIYIVGSRPCTIRSTKTCFVKKKRTETWSSPKRLVAFVAADFAKISSVWHRDALNHQMSSCSPRLRPLMLDIAIASICMCLTLSSCYSADFVGTLSARAPTIFVSVCAYARHCRPTVMLNSLEITSACYPS